MSLNGDGSSRALADEFVFESTRGDIPDFYGVIASCTTQDIVRFRAEYGGIHMAGMSREGFFKFATRSVPEFYTRVIRRTCNVTCVRREGNTSNRFAMAEENYFFGGIVCCPEAYTRVPASRGN